MALADPGVREVLLDSDERPVAVIEIVESRVVRLADVDDRHAIDEGEGYRNAAEFRVAHERFWNSYIDDLRRTIAPDFAIDDDTLVVLQRFKVVERLQDDQAGASHSQWSKVVMAMRTTRDVDDLRSRPSGDWS